MSGSNRGPGREPDRAAMVDWLVSSLGPAGEVMSWTGGYAYPEVGGLWLTALGHEPGLEALVRRVSGWLVGCVDSQGRVGRDGVSYAFDTACVRVGLGTARTALASHSSLDLATIATRLDAMDAALLADLEGRDAAHPAGAARWSTRFSAHMLKLAWALDEAHASRLVQAVALVQDPDGRIRNRSDDPTTYLHAACYALEGLLRLLDVDHLRAWAQPRLAAGLDWLVSMQSPDGTLPAHLDADGRPAGPRPSDVIAQSLRLWTRVDAQRYAEPCERALAALAARQAPDGAIVYAPDIPHRNSWCTVFCVQALDWRAGGAGSLA